MTIPSPSPVHTGLYRPGFHTKPPVNLPNKDYSFPEPDNKGISYVAFRPIYFDVLSGNLLPAAILISSYVTDDPWHSLYFALKKYNNDVHIFNSSTKEDLGNITFGYSAVPEPSTVFAGATALGMLGLFGYRNRK